MVGKREKNLVMVGGPPEAPECVLHQTEKKSVGYGGGVGHVLETPSGDEEKARWGRCWRKEREDADVDGQMNTSDGLLLL